MDETEISLGIEPPVIAAEDAGESDQDESWGPTTTAPRRLGGSHLLASR
jgi:hypothetical protein